MSESGASPVDGGDDCDECPLCLAPLTPFWDTTNRAVAFCCGKYQCKDCMEKQSQYLARARADGTFGRGEVQLQTKCSFCRTQVPNGDREAANMLVDNLAKGRLPLNLHKNLGTIYMNGEGVEKNEERGVEIWRIGAEKGDPNCQCALGGLYHLGGGVEKSPEEARRWYLAAIEQGNAVAENQLAMLLRDDGKNVEYQRYVRSSAAKGYDGACHDLGITLYYGTHGAQKSTHEAIRVLTPAAERGDAACMAALGIIMCCMSPEGMVPPPINPNFTKGMHWLRRAVETGNATYIPQLKDMEKAASIRCFGCKKEPSSGMSFLRCSRCCAAWYCSKDCQVQHWKTDWEGHKQFCIKWRPQKDVL